MTTLNSRHPGDKVFTIPEVAAYLKISKSKIYDLVSRKEIPHLRLGRNVRIRESDLLTWLELQTETPPTTYPHFSADK
jgi:putative molybdopterin biosynthesis protein